jgi:AAA family ATP:ADP antiporter
MKNVPKNHFLAALLMSIAAFFLIAGYEILRSSANSLFKAAYGSIQLPTIVGITAFGIIFALWFYNRLLSFWGPRNTLFFMNMLWATLLVGCYVFIQNGVKEATAILFVVKEVYVVMLVEQYWSFLNSTFNAESGKKLNGPILAVSALGSIVGGFFLSKFVLSWGTESMILISVLTLLPAAFFSDTAYKMCGEPKPTIEEAQKSNVQIGFNLLKSSNLLKTLLILIAFTQFLSAVLEFKFQEQLSLHFLNKDEETAFSGQFFMWIGVVQLFLQLLAPFYLQWVRLGTVQWVIPIIHIGAAIAIILSPTLWTAGFALMAFKAIDYSIFRATKEILYIPLSYDSRYRAKSIIDFMGYRLSKGLMGLTLTGIQNAGILLSPFYGWIALGVGVGWFSVIRPLKKYNQ